MGKSRKIQFSVQFHPILLNRINEYCMKVRRPRNLIIEEFLYRWFMPEFPCLPLQNPKEMTFRDQLEPKRSQEEMDAARQFKPRFGRRTDPLGLAKSPDNAVHIPSPELLSEEALRASGCRILSDERDNEPEPGEETVETGETPEPSTDPELYNPEGGVAPEYENPPLNENADMF